MSSLLLIVDDWEALERYEEKLQPYFDEIEACPMPKEGIERAWEKPWSQILLDLVLEDMTPAEAVGALRGNPLTEPTPLVLVGDTAELESIALREKDLKITRPFEWSALIQQVCGSTS